MHIHTHSARTQTRGNIVSFSCTPYHCSNRNRYLHTHVYMSAHTQTWASFSCTPYHCSNRNRYLCIHTHMSAHTQTWAVSSPSSPRRSDAVSLLWLLTSSISQLILSSMFLASTTPSTSWAYCCSRSEAMTERMPFFVVPVVT
jgi:hypothetical protein